MEGYIKLYRNILDWEWWSDINTYRLFTYMIIKANWKNGKFKGIDVPKGSFVASLDKLSKETNLTINEVRTALKHLKKTKEITSKSQGNFTIFTVNNYSLYQDDNTETTSRPQPINTSLTTIEERKNIKKEKKKENNNYCTEPEIISPVISLTLNDKTLYTVCQSDVDEWQKLYPAVNIIQELRKMKGWCDSNPTKRKTKRGIGRFINSWLSREQDKGGSNYTGKNKKRVGGKNNFLDFEQRDYSNEEINALENMLLRKRE